MENKVFATFGGEQLEGFDVNPMKVALVAMDEVSLRARLRQPPFDNNYCTTYPIRKLAGMKSKYDMVKYTMAELLAKQGG